jgi:hypothetical protein
MSKLRKHLESARAEYVSIRYDGDLAAELLARVHAPAPRMRFGQLMWNISTLAAAAAMIVLVVRVRPPMQTPDIITNNPYPEQELTEVAWSDLPSIEMPAALPNLDTRGDEEMSFAPAAPDFSFAVPSFSIFEETEQRPQEPNAKQETTL